jgi:hypothetical protein
MKPRETAALLTLCALGAAGLWWTSGSEAREITTGKLLLLDGKNDEALVLAKRIAADHDRSATAQVFLAKAELANENLEAAEAAAKRAGVVATPEQQTSVRDLRNEIDAAKKAKAEAAAALEKRCQELLTEVQQGRGDEVHEEIVSLATRNPRHLGGQHLLAVAELKKHNLRLAMETFAKAEALAEGKVREELASIRQDIAKTLAVVERMRDLVDKDDFAAVIAEAQAADDAQLYDYEIYLIAGSAQLALGKLDEAKDVLKKARVLAPPGAQATVDDFLRRRDEAVATKARADKLAGIQKNIRIALASGESEKAANEILSCYWRPIQGVNEKLIPPALFMQVAQACVTAAEASDSPKPELYLLAGGLLEMAKATYPDGNDGEQLAIMAAKISKKTEAAYVDQVMRSLNRSDLVERNLLNGLEGSEGIFRLPKTMLFWEEYSRWFNREVSSDSYREGFRAKCLAFTVMKTPNGEGVANHLRFYTDPKNLPPGSRIPNIKQALQAVLADPRGARLYAWMANDAKASLSIKEYLGCKAEVGKAPCLTCNGSGLGKLRRVTCEDGCDEGRFYRREDRTTQAFAGEYTDSTTLSSRSRWSREMEELRVPRAGVWKEVSRQENYQRGLTAPIRLDDTVRYVRFVSEACSACRGRGYFEYETKCLKCDGSKTGPVLVLTKE